MSKKKEVTLTHSEGCVIAANYLKSKFNCGIVFIEPNPWANSEAPDAIGFRPNNTSVLMEVKVTRGDFLSDRQKPHRINPGKGMGDYRFYACPEGLIKPDELPDNWGLFYFTSRGSMRPVVTPQSFSSLQPPHAKLEYVKKQINKSNGAPLAGYVQVMAEEVDKFCFMAKNVGAEINVLYGGYRMMCLSKKQNVPFEINEVYQRPDIK